MGEPSQEELVAEGSGGDNNEMPRKGRSDLRLFASAEAADLTSLSPEVQAVAHRFNAEFEAVLASEEQGMSIGSGAKIVQRLLPTVVTVLEQLDDFYKDHAAYKAEVIQLREENVSLSTQLMKAKDARRETEDLLMRVEEQFDNERKTLYEALAQNDTQIRRLEMKSKNTEEQLVRMEQKEFESSKENSKLHQRINELLRSHAELNDSLKHSTSMLTPLVKTWDPAPARPFGNAFDTTSAGLGFDGLSAMEGDLTPSADEDFADELSLAIGQNSESDNTHDFAGMQKEVNNLIRENMELTETKNALNIVKDDLLVQRDALKTENQLLKDAVTQLTEKQEILQQEMRSSDRTLIGARTEIEALKATVEKLKKRSEKSSSKVFTKSEMMRLISDRNYYKERFLELRDAIKLMETLRASQRGHPELLNDLPSSVTDVQVHQHSSPHHQFKNAFTRLLSLISLPRLEFGLDSMLLADGDDFDSRPEDTSGTTSSMATTAPGASSSTFNSQRWIRIYQTSAATPIFGWVRGFGRLRQGKTDLPTAKNPTSLFKPIAYPVPKKCRSIGRSTLRIEITAALSVPSPIDDNGTQHLWLIGRGASSKEVAKLKPKNVGKLYVFNPLQLNLALVCMDLEDEFLPISAGLFSVADAKDSPPLAGSGRFIVSNFRSLQNAKTPREPLNANRVLIAASDGRFLVCAATRNPDASTVADSWQVALLSTFRLANPGESATAIVSLGHRICLGVLNSAGSNQLMTLKWYLESTPPPGNDIELNRVLRATALSLPSDSTVPSGPILLSSIFSRAFCCLGTAGGGSLHRFDLNADAFVAHLTLPSQTPCLHAIAVGTEPETSSASPPSTSGCLIWLAVSGLSPPTPTTQQREGGEAGEGVYLGPLSRLLSVCSQNHVFVHNIDLTSVLTSMIDTTGVEDPVDLTVSRLFIQGNECIWFAIRCGLIGRFHIDFLLQDAAVGSPTEVLNQDAISLSCHAYRRPVSALIAIQDQEEETKAPEGESVTRASYLVVAVGHDYTYLRASTPAPRASEAPSPPLPALNQRQQSWPGAYAIVWSVNM